MPSSQLQQLGLDEQALKQIFEANPGVYNNIFKSLQNEGLGDLTNATGGTALSLPSLDSFLNMAITNEKNELKALQNLPQLTVGNLLFSYAVQSLTGGSELGTGFIPEEKVSEPNKIKTFRKGVYLKFVQDVAQTYFSSIMSENVAFPEGNDIRGHNMMNSVLNIMTQIEYCFFHGDSSILQHQFDGIVQQILNYDEQRLPLGGKKPIYDARGSKLVEQVGSTYQLKVLEEAIEIAYKNNAKPPALIYPGVISKQMQEYVQEKLRIVPNNSGSAMTPLTQVAAQYPTSYNFVLNLLGGKGTLAGPQRFFKTKGPVRESAHSDKKPSKPSKFTLAIANKSANETSLFSTSDAGTYKYQIYPLGEYGEIGTPSDISSGQVVAAGRKVTITIKQADSGADTVGFIICRTERNKEIMYEMTRVTVAANGDTIVTDLNENLPNTAQALLISPDYLRFLFLGIGQKIFSDGRREQGSKIISMPLGRENASNRDLVCAFCAADLTVVHSCVLINNLGL